MSGILGPASSGGGGFLGAKASLPSGVSEPLTNNTTALVQGEVVRLSGNSSVTRAQANSAAGVLGTVGITAAGIAAGATGPITTNGRVRVLLDAGLTPTAGQTLYVSAVTAGRGTNAVPAAFQTPIGIVKDASAYATDSSVIADMSLDSVAAGGSTSSGIADWPIGAPRYYAVDYDSGNDANVGFSDTSMALAGVIALRTYERLRQILPAIGAGRRVIIAIRNRALGATYLRQDGITIDTMDVRGLIGYSDDSQVVGTTNFADDATDRTLSGAVVSTAGPNADSSWTVAAGATATTIPVAAGALPASPTIRYKRVRFLTGALAGACRTIFSNTAGVGVITLADAYGVAPGVGDTFLIEQPGVAFGTVLGGNFNAFAFRGIAAVTDAALNWNVVGTGSSLDITFCESRGTSGAPRFQSLRSFTSRRTFAGGAEIVGPGFRTEGAATIDRIDRMETQMWGSVATATAFVRQIITGYLADGGCLWLGRLHVIDSGLQTGSLQGLPLAVNGLWIGRINTTFRDSAIDGAALRLTGVRANVANFDVSNSIGSGIEVNDGTTLPGSHSDLVFQSITGAGNATVGIDFNSATRAYAFINSSVTITGAAGDIRLAGGIVSTIAALSITNVIDSQFNNVSGVGGQIVGQCVRVTNQSGVALTIGDLVRSNGTSAQVTRAQGDSNANASGPLLVIVAPAANTAETYAVPLGRDAAWVNFDAAPAAGVLAYLDEGTAGVATTTVPPVAATNQKRRLGHTLITSGTRARVAGSPELLPVTSNGVAP